VPSKTKDGTWRSRPRYNGARVSRTFDTRAQAFDFEARVRRVRNGSEPPPSESVITFEEFAARWLKEYAQVEKAEDSATLDESIIRTHLDPAFGGVKLRHLTKHHLMKLRAELKDTRKPKTVNNVLGLAKKILRVAKDEGLIAVNPWDTVKQLKVAKQTFDYWEAGERDRFFEAARFISPKFVEAALIAAHTGLRLGELKALRRQDLDFDRRTICVAAGVSFRTGKRSERTKSYRVDHVPMNDLVQRVLYKRVLLDKEAPVFETWVLSGALDKLRRLACRVGVKEIRFHDLRHTFASCLVMAGVDIFTVSKLMRHGSVVQTMRYAHLAPGHLQEHVQRLIAAVGGPAAVPDTGVATLRRRGDEGK
jgi:integrase